MGRPAGVKEAKPRNTAARKHAAELASEGITPLEFLLEVLREQHAIRHDEKRPDEERRAATVLGIGISEKAAPYLHAKLANVQVDADVTHSGTVAVSVYLPDNSRDTHGTEAAARPAGDVPR